MACLAALKAPPAAATTLASGVNPTDAGTVEVPSPVLTVVEMVAVTVDVAPVEVTITTGAVRLCQCLKIIMGWAAHTGRHVESRGRLSNISLIVCRNVVSIAVLPDCVALCVVPTRRINDHGAGNGCQRGSHKEGFERDHCLRLWNSAITISEKWKIERKMQKQKTYST